MADWIMPQPERVVLEVKLGELLQKISENVPVGIWNIDDKNAKCPTPQTYQKIKNIPWVKIRDIIDLDVLAICVNDVNNGVFIRVHNKKRLENRLNNWDLAEKIKKR